MDNCVKLYKFLQSCSNVKLTKVHVSICNVVARGKLPLEVDILKVQLLVFIALIL